MGKAWGVMHGAVMRRLSQTPPVKAYVIVLASPESGADMFAVIWSSKPHSPRKCPPWMAGRSHPITGLHAR